jgi:hypothetical protein
MTGEREFKERYVAAIEQRLIDRALARQAHWTESLAVGSKQFVERVRSHYRNRLKFEMADVGATSPETWTIKERLSAYKAV